MYEVFSSGTDGDISELFTEYVDAVAFANEIGDHLESVGYITERWWASSDNLYAIRAERQGIYARIVNVEIVRRDAPRRLEPVTW
jgi:hypothetical protein